MGLDPVLETGDAAVDAVEVLVAALDLVVGRPLAPADDADFDRLAADHGEQRPAAVAVAGIALAGLQAGADHGVRERRGDRGRQLVTDAAGVVGLDAGML